MMTLSLFPLKAYSKHTYIAIILAFCWAFSNRRHYLQIIVRIAFARGNPMGQVEQWQILAEEAAQEQDPKKLMEIISALTRALDESHANDNGHGTSHKRSAA